MQINLKELILIVLMALLSIFLLFSCKAKKTTTERTKTSDTLLIKSFDYVSQPISANYSFELECDSLGNIKPFEFNEKSGNNQAGLSIKNNRLDARLLTGISQIKNDSLFQKSKFERDFDKQKKVYVTDWKTIIILSLILLISVAVNVVFLYQKFKPKLPF